MTTFVICQLLFVICTARTDEPIDYFFDELRQPINLGVLEQGSSGCVRLTFPNTTGKQVVIASTFGSCGCMEIQPINKIVPAGGNVELRVKVAASKVGTLGLSGGIVFACGETSEAKLMRSTFQLSYVVPPKSAFPSDVFPIQVDPFRPKPVSITVRNPWKYELFEPEIRLDADIGKATLVKSDVENKGASQEYLAEIVFSESFLSKLVAESQDVSLLLLAKQSVGSLVCHELDTMVLNVSEKSSFVVKGVQVGLEGDLVKVSINVLQGSKDERALADCELNLMLYGEADATPIEISYTKKVISPRWVELECSYSNVEYAKTIRVKITNSGKQLGTVLVPMSRKEK